MDPENAADIWGFMAVVQGTFGEDLFLQLDLRFDLARTRLWQCLRCACMADIDQEKIMTYRIAMSHTMKIMHIELGRF